MTDSVTRNASWLALGTVIGQLALILAMPVISRLFTPEDMGFYTTYVAIVGIVSVTASLHYELALPLPKTEKSAKTVLMLCHVVLLLVCLVFAVAYLLLQTTLEDALNINSALDFELWLPVTLLLTGAVTIWTFWSVRQKQFKANGLSKAAQGVIQSFSQLLAGLAGMGVAGLIFGQVAGLLVALAMLVLPFRIGVTGGVSKRHVARLMAVAKRYRNFAVAASPSSLINALSNSLPPLLLIYFFDSVVVGLFGLGMRMLLVPSRLMGQAFSQSFFALAIDAHRQGSLSELTDKSFRALYSASLWSFLPLAVGAESIFSFVFGEPWRGAGVYAQLLTPWLIVGFAVTPLSMLVTVLEKQKTELSLQLLYFASTVSALLIGGFMGNDKLAILLLSLGGAAFFIGKIRWLLTLSGAASRGLWRYVVIESSVALVICAGLYLAFLGIESGLVELVLVFVTVSFAHSVNFKFRGLYAV